MRIKIARTDKYFEQNLDAITAHINRNRERCIVHILTLGETIRANMIGVDRSHFQQLNWVKHHDGQSDVGSIHLDQVVAVTLLHFDHGAP